MTCTITFIGADNNAPTWASPYLEFREQLFGRRKNDLVDLLDMECTAFVTVFLFSLRSRTACLSPSHGMLAVNYVQVLDVLALVDMSDSRPIDNVALTYVCNCAKLSYKEVRSAVISARAWFAGQERLDQKAVRTASRTNLCAWYYNDAYDLAPTNRVLFEFATFVFAVVITSGPVESSFSVAKWVKSKGRTQLSNDKVFGYLHLKDLKRQPMRAAFLPAPALRMKDFLTYNLSVPKPNEEGGAADGEGGDGDGAGGGGGAGQGGGGVAADADAADDIEMLVVQELANGR